MSERNQIENYQNLLRNKFPEFLSKMKPEDLEPFMFFGDFGIYLRDLIDSDASDKGEIDRAFDFLNVMGESPDEDVHNLLTVGVLEILTDSNATIETANQKLKGEALKNFNNILGYWS